MRSPPDSIPRSTSKGRDPTPNSSLGCEDDEPPSRQQYSLMSVEIPSFSMDAEGPLTRRLGPPSPASTGSAIAVGSTNDAAVIQSIEKGEYVDGDSYPDDTRSLTESIRQHIVDGGLRYHAYHAGKYAFPNDETEQMRDNLKHDLTIHLCEGDYYYSPIHHVLEKGAQVLDLGTGTGKWCIDLADMYPESEFHGMDLSPIQPDWVPENVLFVVDDIEHEGGWTYEDETFDLIHVRHTLHSIKDRPELWDRIYKHLKPGGYVEIQEFQYMGACDDTSCDEPYAWRDFANFLKQGLAALGSDLHGIVHVEGELIAAGFQDLRCKSLKCPIGPWPKKRRLQECGHILRDVILWGLIQMFLIDVRNSLTVEVNGLPKYHSYFPFYSVYGRKPLNAQ